MLCVFRRRASSEALKEAEPIAYHCVPGESEQSDLLDLDETLNF